MITLAKINIFKRYRGEIDNWARSGTKKEKIIMNDEDWYKINDFIQDLRIINNGLASQEFIKKIEVKLQIQCDSLETIQSIKDFVA